MKEKIKKRSLKSLWRILTTWRFRPKGLLHEGECYIAFAFGWDRRDDGSRRPGWSNEVLAELLRKLLNRKFLPVAAQWEVQDSFQNMLLTSGQMEHAEKFFRIERDPQGQYLDSYGVLQQALRFIQENGFHRVIVLAHPAHVQRIVWLLAARGIESIVPDGLSAVPYNPMSAQPWTRGPIPWHFWELAARLVSWWRGWIAP